MLVPLECQHNASKGARKHQGRCFFMMVVVVLQQEGVGWDSRRAPVGLVRIARTCVASRQAVVSIVRV